ncbi:hypothetical protein TNCV_4448521 [Trichonephila clavipes]|nr:hypothetical protein TNCV_4448521 [Trichonephila clavipes]
MELNSRSFTSQRPPMAREPQVAEPWHVLKLKSGPVQGYKLVAGTVESLVQTSVPKTHPVEGLIHIKSAVAQSSNVGWV